MTKFSSIQSRSLKILATTCLATGFIFSTLPGAGLAEKHRKGSDDQLAIERGDKPAKARVKVPDKTKFKSGRVGKRLSPEAFKKRQAEILEKRKARIKRSLSGLAEIKPKG